jgi:hypothetical protein
MARALSLTLRVRVLAAVARGLSPSGGGRTIRDLRRERQPVAGARARGGRSAQRRCAETGDPDGSRRTKTRSSRLSKKRPASRLKSSARRPPTKA